MTVDKQAAGVDRRSFLKVGGVAAGAILSGTALQMLAARVAEAAPVDARWDRPGANVDYGPIKRSRS